MKLFIFIIIHLVTSLPHSYRKKFYRNLKSIDLSSVPSEQWFNQRLNHFEESDLRTWKQRYWINSSHFDSNIGPVFIMIGGEGEENPIWLTHGHWIDLAKEFKALCVMLEHRFYGNSRPTDDLRVENLKYLSSEQALADLASFRQFIQKEFNLTNVNKWISHGGSYPGSLSAWWRLKYPHLVHGAISSSAPMVALVDFTDYLNVVNSSLEYFAPGCSSHISKATNEVEKMIRSETGKQALEKFFKTCSPIQTSLDITNFHATVAGNLENVVQYNRDNRAFEGAVDTNLTIEAICSIMTNDAIGTPFYRYTVVNSLILQTYNETCLDASYSKYINDMREVSWNSSQSVGGRQWMWQTCTEFGFYQSTDSQFQPFGQTFPIDFFTRQCQEIFGNEYDEKFIDKSVEHTNTNYGANDYYASRVMFVNGAIDPWHSLGFYKNPPNKHTEISFMKSTAHCADMYPKSDDDPQELKETREKIKKAIENWLKEDSLF